MIRGAEIGVDSGKLTRLLLQKNPRLKLIAVDYWPSDYPDGPWERGQGPARGEQKQNLKRARFYKKVLLEFGERVRLIEKSSIMAAHDISDGTLDFVFLDGDHSFDGVMADIMAWTPKIRHGGYLLGHDYSEQYFPGVIRAVDQSFKRADVMLLPDFIWCARV